MTILTCTIRLEWNGQTVLEGRATCTAAYDAAQQFLDGNFAGVEHHRQMAALQRAPHLERLISGQPMDVAYSDSTGAARAVVIPGVAA